MNQTYCKIMSGFLKFLMLYCQAMYKQLRLEPYAVHTTFQYAGTEGKRHRLREAMVFYDPPEYYDTPGNTVPVFYVGALLVLS